jgi:Zn-dependent protease
LRAAHRLLHGDIAGAWRFNPLLVALAPVLGLWAVAYGLNQPTGEALLRFVRKPAVAWGIVTVVLLFGILRNIGR